MADNSVERRPQTPDGGRPRPPMTPLERSLLPSFWLTGVVLIAGMFLTRLRLPPLPFSLLIVIGLWLVCFIGVYMWQVQRLRSGRR